MEIFLLAGEESGDLHGSNLVAALAREVPNARFRGIGGQHLAAVGVELLADLSELSVVGLLEVAGRIPAIWRAFRRVRRSLIENPPDLLVAIDFPDFNMRVLPLAHRLRVPIVYYIPPQVWAWRRGRARKLARTVDLMLTIFPFEQSFLRRFGLRVEYVGHPLSDEMKFELARAELAERYALNPAVPWICVMPGSRISEIQRLLSPMLQAVRLLQEKIGQLEVLLIRAREIPIDRLASGIGANVRIVDRHKYDFIRHAELVIVASGTATVETAICGTPMIVCYRLSPLSFAAARLLVNVRDVAMVNIVAGRRVVPELLQGEVTPERIVEEAISLLNEPSRRSAMRQQLADIKRQLLWPGASLRAATAIRRLLEERVRKAR